MSGNIRIEVKPQDDEEFYLPDLVETNEEEFEVVDEDIDMIHDSTLDSRIKNERNRTEIIPGFYTVGGEYRDIVDYIVSLSIDPNWDAEVIHTYHSTNYAVYMGTLKSARSDVNWENKSFKEIASPACRILGRKYQVYDEVNRFFHKTEVIPFYTNYHPYKLVEYGTTHFDHLERVRNSAQETALQLAQMESALNHLERKRKNLEKFLSHSITKTTTNL